MTESPFSHKILNARCELCGQYAALYPSGDTDHLGEVCVGAVLKQLTAMEVRLGNLEEYIRQMEVER